MATIARWKPIICEEEISKSLFDAEQKKWFSQIGSTEKSASDFIWSMFNRKIDMIGGKNLNFKDRYTLLTKVYWNMIQFLLSEERDTTHIRAAVNRLDLEKFELEDTNSDHELAVEIIVNK